MGNFIQNAQLRLLELGIFVQGSAKTVPQNATQTIFTVTGGRIAVVLLTSTVTTIMGGTTPSAKYVSTPTTGTANDMCTAVAITAAEVGAMICCPGAPGSALNIGTSLHSGSVAGPTSEQIVNIGNIGFNVSAADATGALQHTLIYIPIDSGAAVVAA